MTQDDLTLLKTKSSFRKLRLLMVDYDGTLVPLRSKPALAMPSDKLLNILLALNQQQQCRLAIISGRSIQNLRALLPVTGITMAGCHGSEVLEGGDLKPVALVNEALLSLFIRLAPIIRNAVGNIPGILVENKTYGIAMHYRAASAKDAALAKGRFQQTILNCEESRNLKISHNKCVIEATPRNSSKASAIRHILMTGRILPEEAAYIGDDQTDEDAFVYLNPRGITIKVAPFPCLTAARFRLADQDRVMALLEYILQEEKL
jgi:trehalose 6-phosphate phosphatase